MSKIWYRHYIRYRITSEPLEEHHMKYICKDTILKNSLVMKVISLRHNILEEEIYILSCVTFKDE